MAEPVPGPGSGPGVITVSGSHRIPLQLMLLGPVTSLKISPVAGALRKSRVKAHDEKWYQKLIKEKEV